MKKPTFVFTLLFVLICLICAKPVLAQILIEQGKVKLSVNPGEAISGVLMVHNTSGGETIHIKVYWEDFEYISPFDGKKKFMPRGTSKYSCSQWLSFSPQEFTMGPKSRREINYSVKVPGDAGGGYYGVMFFESKVGEPEGDIGIKIVARVGSLFFIETKNSKKDVTLEDFNHSENGIQANFVNKGNIFLIPKGVFYIIDSEGHAVRRGELDKFYMPPGSKVSFAIPIPDELNTGKYTIVLTFDLGDGNSIVREVDFEKDRSNEVAIKDVRK